MKFLRFFFLAFFFLPSVSYAFSDVLSTSEFFDAVSYVESQGMVQGYSDGTFRPHNQINRAEFTKIIVEATFSSSEIDECIGKNIKPEWTYVFFPDVKKNEWFSKYICVAKTQGIITGYADGTFKPAQNISFVEASKIIVNAFGWQVKADTVWYKPFVFALSEKNAIPVSVTAFDQNITRAEMTEIIYRVKANVTNKLSQTYNILVGIHEEIPASLAQIEALPYNRKAPLRDVSGGNASGTAKSVFLNGEYRLYAVFSDLPKPKEGKYYAGWLKKKQGEELIPTGIVGKIDEKALLIYMAKTDFTDFDTFFVTLESDEETENLGEVILEGVFLPL